MGGISGSMRHANGDVKQGDNPQHVGSVGSHGTEGDKPG